MDLTVIVSGREVKLKVQSSITIRSLATQALAKSGDRGQQLDEWEMRSKDGLLLEYGVTLFDYGLKSGRILYLSPKAGVGASIVSESSCSP